MSELLNLKFPEGEFTQRSLADHNGYADRTKIWSTWVQLQKDGVIVKFGEPKSFGKGKPSQGWIRSDKPVPTVVPAPVTVTVDVSKLEVSNLPPVADVVKRGRGRPKKVVTTTTTAITTTNSIS